jgi:hypothetical protein
MFYPLNGCTPQLNSRTKESDPLVTGVASPRTTRSRQASQRLDQRAAEIFSHIGPTSDPLGRITLARRKFVETERDEGLKLFANELLSVLAGLLKHAATAESNQRSLDVLRARRAQTGRSLQEDRYQQLRWACCEYNQQVMLFIHRYRRSLNRTSLGILTGWFIARVGDEGRMIGLICGLAAEVAASDLIRPFVTDLCHGSVADDLRGIDLTFLLSSDQRGKIDVKYGESCPDGLIEWDGERLIFGIRRGDLDGPVIRPAAVPAYLKLLERCFG